MLKTNHLKPGAWLKQRYQIEDVLGAGGFGITYVATEENKKVAIKEYFPSGNAYRMEDGSVVVGDSQDLFVKEKKNFLKEGELLKEFQYLEGIVSVLDSFEEHGSAYIVMEYIEGITLKTYVQENGTLSYDELLSLMKPIIKSLVKIHAQGVIHRDISPENIMLGLDNRLTLIDFGAARQQSKTGKNSKTVILKSGYAPPEQYLSDGKQGAWTDVYGICATMYEVLTRTLPPESLSRFERDELKPIRQYCEDILDWQDAAIRKGMSVEIAQRYRDMEELYHALVVPPNLEKQDTIYSKDVSKRIRRKIQGEHRIYSLFVWMILGIIIVGMIFGVFYKKGVNQGKTVDSTSQIIESTTQTTTSSASTAQSSTERLITVPLLVMPSLIEKTQTEAQQELQQLDDSIAVIIQESYSNTVSKGVVIDQSVLADTTFNQGSISSITLTVSLGAEATTAATTASSPVRSTQASSQTPSKKKQDYDNFETEDDFSTIHLGE